MKNKALLVLGALILIGSFAGAIQYSSSQNLQSAALKSDVADKAITDKSLARINPGAGVGGEKVFLMGGENVGFLNDVWSSLDGSTWKQVTSSANWSPRNVFGAVYFNGKIILFGGQTSTGFVGDVWSSSDGINWTQLIQNAPWSPRADHASLVFDNKIWVMDGFPASPIHDVWSSPDGINWTQMGTLPFGVAMRSGFSAVTYGSQMFVMGGCCTMSSQQYNDVWSSSDGISWTQVTTSANWQGRSGHDTIVINNKMVIMGGGIAPLPTFLNDVWDSTNGNNWNLLNGTSLWLGRASFTTVITPATFGCSLRASMVPNTAQLNSGTHVKTYEFQVTTCANPVTLTQIDFNTSQTSGVKRTNIKLETNNTAIAIPQPPVGSSAVYPIFKPNYTVPAYTTQTFTVTEDIGGNIVTGSSISSNLMKMTANFGSNTISWTNTFPLGATILTH